jgi:hypothetical protein
MENYDREKYDPILTTFQRMLEMRSVIDSPIRSQQIITILGSSFKN